MPDREGEHPLSPVPLHPAAPGPEVGRLRLRSLVHLARAMAELGARTEIPEGADLGVLADGGAGRDRVGANDGARAHGDVGEDTPLLDARAAAETAKMIRELRDAAREILTSQEYQNSKIKF